MPSDAPGDQSVIFRWQGKGCLDYATTNRFTVYSVRLIPDLNGDGTVDDSDRTLVRQMPEQLGWSMAVEPGKRHPVQFQCDVNLPGEFTLRLDGEDEAFRLYDCLNPDAPPILTNGTIPIWGSTRSYWIEAVKEGGGSLTVTYTGTGDADGFACKAELKLTALGLKIAGDGGIRDQAINFDDPDDTNIVFWVNNDYDVVHNKDHEEYCHEDDREDVCKHRNCDDDIIGAGTEENSNQAECLDGWKNEMEDTGGSVLGDSMTPIFRKYTCYRDLEDFDRLHIKLPDIILGMTGLTYEFRIVPSEDNPSINLFRAVEPDLFYISGVDKRDRVEEQVNETRLLLVDPLWDEISPADYKYTKLNYFLYEGRTEGKGTLMFRIRFGDVILAETSLSMELCDASKFVDTYQIHHTAATLASDGDEYALTVGDYRKMPATVMTPWNSENEVTILILGWNVIEAEEKAWRDTLFKRLFWQGYRGRTAAFIWPKLWGFKLPSGLLDGPHFDRSEHRAWLSASKAKRLLSELLGKWNHVTVIAHSQGNVVASEALKELSKEPNSGCDRITYIACQSAISAQYFETKFKDDNIAHQLDVFSAGTKTLKVLGDIWRFATWNYVPDIQGHFPNGWDCDNPYLYDGLSKLKHTANFYNRMDYALNIWVGNNASKPDNLAFDFTYDTDEKCYYGETMNAAGKKVKIPINPEEERARWCIFAFVAYTRALAVGQLDMNGVFNRSCDLANDYELGKTHYHHSFEFRSNIIDTYAIWSNIMKEITRKRKENQDE